MDVLVRRQILGHARVMKDVRLDAHIALEKRDKEALSRERAAWKRDAMAAWGSMSRELDDGPGLSFTKLCFVHYLECLRSAQCF